MMNEIITKMVECELEYAVRLFVFHITCTVANSEEDKNHILLVLRKITNLLLVRVLSILCLANKDYNGKSDKYNLSPPN